MKNSSKLQLLYPQYILSTREQTLQGVEGYDKWLNSILVDANGFIDVMEIKRQTMTANGYQERNRRIIIYLKDNS